MFELLSNEDKEAICRLETYANYLAQHLYVLRQAKDELDFNYWKDRVLDNFMVISESVKVFQKGASND